MNREDYVSLEVAKLLKEKGFNEPVFSQYTNRESVWYCNEPENFNESVDCFSRPTLYEAAKWLREKHNIHIMIGVDDLDWWYQLYNCSEDGRMEDSNHIYGSVACKKSYEEALNDGILEALKLI